jgi:hypothetical protein
MGYANHVEVRAMSFIDAPTDGSEQLPSQVQRYKTTDADLRMTYSEEGDTGTSESGWETGREGAENAVAQYGEIWAPVVYVPEQCTYDECRKRALQLLARYKTFLNRTLPAVVGRQPHLETWVSYKFRRLLDEAWQTSPLQEGKAVSTKGSYSSRGWISYIEVAPKVLSDSATEYIYGDQSYTDDGTSSEV